MGLSRGQAADTASTRAVGAALPGCGRTEIVQLRIYVGIAGKDNITHNVPTLA